MVIRVNDFIANGYSQQDAELLAPKIKEAVGNGETFVVDFAKLQYFTTLFFSTALTRWVGELGIDKYKRLIEIKNLSESGKETYEHALEYAEQFFNKTAAEQRLEQNIVDNETEDL